MEQTAILFCNTYREILRTVVENAIVIRTCGILAHTSISR